MNEELKMLVAEEVEAARALAAQLAVYREKLEALKASIDADDKEAIANAIKCGSPFSEAVSDLQDCDQYEDNARNELIGAMSNL